MLAPAPVTLIQIVASLCVLAGCSCRKYKWKPTDDKDAFHPRDPLYQRFVERQAKKAARLAAGGGGGGDDDDDAAGGGSSGSHDRGSHDIGSDAALDSSGTTRAVAAPAPVRAWWFSGQTMRPGNAMCLCVCVFVCVFCV